MTPQEGRKALDEMLSDEVSDAKDEFLRSLARAEAFIAEARGRVEAGLALPTSATGNAMIVPEDLNDLGTLWMAAERRRVRLLALYDRTNGTVAEV